MHNSFYLFECVMMSQKIIFFFCWVIVNAGYITWPDLTRRHHSFVWDFTPKNHSMIRPKRSVFLCNKVFKILKRIMKVRNVFWVIFDATNRARFVLDLTVLDWHEKGRRHRDLSRSRRTRERVKALEIKRNLARFDVAKTCYKVFYIDLPR